METIDFQNERVLREERGYSPVCEQQIWERYTEAKNGSECITHKWE